MADKQVLISFKTMMSRDPKVFGDAMKVFAKELKIERISSIYRVHRKAESFSSVSRVGGEEVLDGYSCVVLAAAKQTPQQLIGLIHRTEEALRSEQLRRSLSCNLLAYGNEVL